MASRYSYIRLVCYALEIAWSPVAMDTPGKSPKTTTECLLDHNDELCPIIAHLSRAPEKMPGAPRDIGECSPSSDPGRGGLWLLLMGLEGYASALEYNVHVLPDRVETFRHARSRGDIQTCQIEWRHSDMPDREATFRHARSRGDIQTCQIERRHSDMPDREETTNPVIRINLQDLLYPTSSFIANRMI